MPLACRNKQDDENKKETHIKRKMKKEGSICKQNEMQGLAEHLTPLTTAFGNHYWTTGLTRYIREKSIFIFLPFHQ